MTRARRLRRSGRPAALALLTGALLVATCRPAPFTPEPASPVAAMDSSEVEAVLLLVGDAGDAVVERSPLVHRLRADVERWSARLPADTSVAVLFLGDNVYPWGLRDRTHPAWPADSARLHAQVWTVSGPEARRDGTPGLFLPGNHDWGPRTGPAGRARLRNQARFLERVRGEGGAAVAMVPSPGASGPVVLELADAARLVLLDTEWWIRRGPGDGRDRVLTGLEELLDTPSDRPTVVAAHHPLFSGGPHAERGILGPLGLLARAGAVVQDRSAAPYAALVEGLTGVFARVGPPLVYAAGHDHVLQVLEATAPDQPRWSLVSGAASKISHVTDVPGLLWAAEAPGYMRLLFRRDGSVEVHVEQVDPEYLRCEGDGAVRTRCLQAGLAAFRTEYTRRLRAGGDAAGTGSAPGPTRSRSLTPPTPPR